MLGEIMNDCCDVYNIDEKESKTKSPPVIIPSDKIPMDVIPSGQNPSCSSFRHSCQGRFGLDCSRNTKFSPDVVHAIYITISFSDGSKDRRLPPPPPRGYHIRNPV